MKAGPAAARARSASTVTALEAVLLLLARLGSVAVGPTVKVLASVPVASEAAATVIESEGALPGASGAARVQVTVPVAAAQDQPLPAEPVKVAPAGSA